MNTDHMVRLRLANGYQTPFIMVLDLEEATPADRGTHIQRLAQTGADEGPPDWLRRITVENVVHPGTSRSTHGMLGDV
jgi:hypothetical protein